MEVVSSDSRNADGTQRGPLQGSQEFLEGFLEEASGSTEGGAFPWARVDAAAQGGLGCEELPHTAELRVQGGPPMPIWARGIKEAFPWGGSTVTDLGGTLSGSPKTDLG